jgi:hypothetical protein
MPEGKPRIGLFGIFAGGMAICCGIPLLLSIGLLGAAGGIGVGSWFLIATGCVLVVAGAWRWLRRRSTCEVPQSQEVASFETESDDRAL